MRPDAGKKHHHVCEKSLFIPIVTVLHPPALRQPFFQQVLSRTQSASIHPNVAVAFSVQTREIGGGGVERDSFDKATQTRFE